MCPFGSSLLVGMASGGIRRLQIGSENIVTRQPRLVEVSGAWSEARMWDVLDFALDSLLEVEVCFLVPLAGCSVLLSQLL